MAEAKYSQPISATEIEHAVRNATAAIQAGNVDAANDIARAATDAGAEHPFLLKVQALWHHDHGRYQEALRGFHHARTLTSQDPSILNGIAACLSAMGEHAAALKMVDAALDVDPDAFFTHYLRGWVLEAGGDYRGACQAYERTIAAEPRHVQALAGLASASVRLEDFAAARTYAQKALALAPDMHTAILALAMTELGQDAPAAAEGQMRGLLDADTNLPPKVQAIAYGILGDALDAQDRIADAFAAYARENEILRSLHAHLESVTGRGPDELNLLASALEALPAWERPAATHTPTGPKTHIFLLGFPRSGTTLLEQVLACHPDLVDLEEQNLFGDTAQIWQENPQAVSRLREASADDLSEAREHYWRAIGERNLDVAGKILLDKQPFNTAKLPLIARLFPDAKIIFALRDPRDVVLSVYRRHFETAAITYGLLTLDGAANLYDAMMRVGAACREKLPLAFHEHKYEAMVEDFDAQIKAVCEFCGIEQNEAMHDFAKNAAKRDIASISAPQVRRGLYSEGMGQWRRYAKQLQPVMPVLESWVKAFQYPKD